MDYPFEHLTPTWLTNVLYAHGHLLNGRVVRFDGVRTIEYLHSWHAFFGVRYSRDVQAAAPLQLCLKLSKAHARSSAARELAFYTQIAPLLDALPLVTCYATGQTPAGLPYLLLADLSASHHVVGDLVGQAHAEVMVALLAQLHASCWERLWHLGAAR